MNSAEMEYNLSNHSEHYEMCADGIIRMKASGLFSKEDRLNEEYVAKYCTPSVCEVCRLCKHCEECVCDDAEALKYTLMQIRIDDAKKIKGE